jgi:hypothetical protein
MQAYAPDPRIRLYFLINSASIPMRSISVRDARVHIDVLNAPAGDKKWLTTTSAGVVPTETVIGGASKRVRAVVY